MSQAAPQIQWPAIIKCHNDDELQFVAADAQWQAILASGNLQNDDALIDSGGSRFILNAQRNSLLLDAKLSLTDVLELARQHASVCGQCCVSKMTAPDIASAVALIEQID